MQTRTCKKCKRTLPIESFKVRRNHGHLCADCRPEYTCAARARAMVTNALYTHKLIRPDVCEKCGRERRTHKLSRLHAHHEDYSKPLAVVWLCASCHRARHGQLKRELRAASIGGLT